MKRLPKTCNTSYKLMLRLLRRKMIFDGKCFLSKIFYYVYRAYGKSQNLYIYSLNHIKL